jgi:hypothetical protein
MLGLSLLIAIWVRPRRPATVKQARRRNLAAQP